MEINIKKTKELIKEKFRGNQTFFAETIGFDRHYLNQILKEKKKSSSPKLCDAVINYCIVNNLKKEDYIFFDNMVKKN